MITFTAIIRNANLHSQYTNPIIDIGDALKLWNIEQAISSYALFHLLSFWVKLKQPSDPPTHDLSYTLGAQLSTQLLPPRPGW